VKISIAVLQTQPPEFVGKRLQHPQTFNFKQENANPSFGVRFWKNRVVFEGAAARGTLASLRCGWEWRPCAAVWVVVFGQGLKAKFKEKTLSLHILEEAYFKTSV